MTENKERTNTNLLFHAKLIMALTDSSSCPQIYNLAAISDTTLYQHSCRKQKYSVKSICIPFFEWFDSLKSSFDNYGENIELVLSRFVLFTKNELDLNLQVLSINPFTSRCDIEEYHTIVKNIIMKWFRTIESYYEKTRKMDDLEAHPDLSIALKKAVISTLSQEKTRTFLRIHTNYHIWKKFQEDYKFGIVLNAVEIESDAREYLDSIIRFGSKSVQALDRIYNLAMKGNLMACYELGNIELYAHNYDLAWLYWTKTKTDSEGTVTYSSTLISLADILINHKRYKKISPAAFRRLEQIPSFADIYSNVAYPRSYEEEILNLLIAAATKDNSIAYNMIGNEIKDHNDIIGFSITSSCNDPIVFSLNRLLEDIPTALPEIEKHPFLRFHEYAGNCGNAFSKNVFFKEVAFGSDFSNASKALRIKAVTAICESAELGNHYGLTKAATFLLGEGFPTALCDLPSERLVDISISDIHIPEYECLHKNQFIEKGYEYLKHAIQLITHSNYYMPYVFMAYYFNSKSPYHDVVARQLANDGFNDETALNYLDIAISHFDEKSIPKLLSYRDMIS